MTLNKTVILPRKQLLLELLHTPVNEWMLTAFDPLRREASAYLGVVQKLRVLLVH